MSSSHDPDLMKFALARACEVAGVSAVVADPVADTVELERPKPDEIVAAAEAFIEFLDPLNDPTELLRAGRDLLVQSGLILDSPDGLPDPARFEMSHKLIVAFSEWRDAVTVHLTANPPF